MLVLPQGYKLPEGTKKVTVDIPRRGSVFDFVYSAYDRRWKHMESALVAGRAIAADASFAEIVVPTVVSERFHYLAALLLEVRPAAALVAPCSASLTATRGAPERPQGVGVRAVRHWEVAVRVRAAGKSAIGQVPVVEHQLLRHDEGGVCAGRD